MTRVRRLLVALAVSLGVSVVAAPPSVAAAGDVTFYLTASTPRGAAITSARFEIVTPDGTLLAKTSDVGGVRFEQPAGTVLTVRVTDLANEYLPATLENVVVEANAFTDVVLKPAALVQGQVLRESADGPVPAAGAVVTVTGSSTTLTTKAAPNGRFRVKMLPAGTYRVNVRQPGGAYFPAAPVTVTLKGGNWRTLDTVTLAARP